MVHVGARPESLRADHRRLRVELHTGTESRARRAVDALREASDTVELVAYHEDAPDQTARGFGEEIRDRLTERQHTALKKAHASGFFEWPRAVDGEQLASSIGVVPATFHQHLQAAEEKVFMALFDG